ncbi:MAG: N-6 DNA methylase [Roseibium sp.]|uniref:Eco57I restriction-modification methylase domain-containing protein n=1 Tax=Roseibium sp. TaxID=1936156 RepID=UPI002603CF25|nr:DNA methyltransferase [Roseibium sp.]MCV0427041.1 N-6 DNA methylase [Roseibium sp.]
MSLKRNTYISKNFLKSVWAVDYEVFKNSEQEKALRLRLQNWADRTDLGETSSEAAFIATFFEEIWEYKHTGRNDGSSGYDLYPQYPVKGAGQKGGTGKADLAIGLFGSETNADTPQILAEFKDIKSNLDAYQNRKGNNRSPVKQALDYLAEARRGMYLTEAIVPTWAIVTDMNEFRLYWFDRAPEQYLSFVIKPKDLFQGKGLLDATEKSRFDLFLFSRVFHRDFLLTQGGKSKLEQLISRQWVQQRELENTFYKDYRAFRERLYEALVESNPDFSGTKGRLVRLAQKILDRCIFIFFCEDMGSALNYPPQLLRNLLINDSRDEFYDPEEHTIWDRLKSLFKSMNEGAPFRQHKINQFNGGLFAEDPELNALEIPNRVFCVPGQGENEASLNAHKETLLYLSAAYNYASEGLNTDHGHEPIPGDSAKTDPSKSLGLYTLGRIFEQSITELEILEAKADGLLSINEESKRKRDGVFYTPEWVVEKVVHHTISPLFHELKAQAGWPSEENKYPTQDAIESYRSELRKIKILDPACGSGAFLITSLRYLVTEWHALRGLEEVAARAELEKAQSSKKGITKARRRIRDVKNVRDDASLINDILKENIYGVDINPASVEISRLALWLHTARGDKPLSSLESTIKTGNSLIGPDFYEGRMDIDLYDADQRERINAFDWRKAFKEVFADGGFDAVVGNPPYVKLQNFRKVHADMAERLKTRADGSAAYESTQTGNFDLYLPFIEQGLRLLNKRGRMGYICPSLWEMNDYGIGLRGLIERGRNLEGWINFRAFQIFDEAITYCALQFFSKRANDTLKIAMAGDGEVSENPWPDESCELPYEQIAFGNRWLLLTGKERNLLDKMYASCNKLGDQHVSKNIFQGVKTGADPVYKLRRIGTNKYAPTTGKNGAQEFDIEDELMHPILSGDDAKRYYTVESGTFLLFPYEFSTRQRLIPEEKFKKLFPLAWNYLNSFKDILETRDGGDLKGAEWYRFSRSQSLDKVGFSKLFIAGTAPEIRCSIDVEGKYFLTGGRLDGIVPAETSDLYYLQGILNSKTCGFVFKRIARIKDNNFYEANKQFIAPLPIPNCTDDQKRSVATQAEMLQKTISKRHDLANRIAKRTGSLKHKKRPINWLFPDLPALDDLSDTAPKSLGTRARKAWAKSKLTEAITAKYEEITGRLNPTASLSTKFEDGELAFYIDHTPIISGIWLNENDGRFISAQWDNFIATFNITYKTDGKKLCEALLKIGETDNAALRDQIVKLQGELAEFDRNITSKEQALDTEIYNLYNLSEEEIRLVEEDRL